MYPFIKNVATIVASSDVLFERMLRHLVLYSSSRLEVTHSSVAYGANEIVWLRNKS